MDYAACRNLQFGIYQGRKSGPIAATSICTRTINYGPFPVPVLAIASYALLVQFLQNIIIVLVSVPVLELS